MAEISLTTWDVWNPKNDGINYQPQLVSRISAINSMCTFYALQNIITYHTPSPVHVAPCWPLTLILLAWSAQKSRGVAVAVGIGFCPFVAESCDKDRDISATIHTAASLTAETAKRTRNLLVTPLDKQPITETWRDRNLLQQRTLPYS